MNHISIELASPEAFLDQEKNSKQIKQNSKLFRILTNLRTSLQTEFNKYMDCRELHTDLSLNLPNKYTREQLNIAISRRAKLVHNTTVDLSDEKAWGFMGVGERAFVLYLPTLEAKTEYECTPHITIAYFRIHGKNCLPLSYQTRILKHCAHLITL